MTERPADSARPARRRPGPPRLSEGPEGPEEVRRAILDAAELLFGEQGIRSVSLRDIARTANVQVSLVNRYFTGRQGLIAAVVRDLGEKVADDILHRPLEAHGFGNGTLMMRWTRVAAALAIESDESLEASPFNPVTAIAQTIKDAYGLPDEAARLRAAQVVGSALGWRVFESYLVTAGSLEDIPTEVLHEELLRTHRRTGATPWPSPADPERI